MKIILKFKELINITKLEEYQEILKEIDDVNTDLEILNAKIIYKLSKKYNIQNSIKHLGRPKKLIKGSMQSKYGHLT